MHYLIVVADKGMMSCSVRSALSGHKKERQKAIDKATGEYEMTRDYIVFLDEERIDEGERLDGYCVICMNVTGLSEGRKPFIGRLQNMKSGRSWPLPRKCEE
jgi:hypothetical protein